MAETITPRYSARDRAVVRYLRRLRAELGALSQWQADLGILTRVERERLGVEDADPTQWAPWLRWEHRAWAQAYWSYLVRVDAAMPALARYYGIDLASTGDDIGSEPPRLDDHLRRR